MLNVLGIDTSNYTTSLAVVNEGGLIYDERKLLSVKKGERGLRQSEALFQHVKNIPDLLENISLKDISAVCVSTKPRPIEDSYMPVFLAGERFAKAISLSKSIPLFFTTHQEGHIEAAVRSIDFKEKKFIAFHLSGGTSEIIKVSIENDYKINKIGGTKDISFGQFIDRLGVAMGFGFPSGKIIDEIALNSSCNTLRIPSRVEGYFFNLSGQETMGLKYIKDGYNQEEIAYAIMVCVAKTIDKLINKLIIDYNLPIILIGGVSSSKFLREYFKNKYVGKIFFSRQKMGTDNAVGVAYIGLKKIKGEL